MFLDQPLNAMQFLALETAAIVQANGLKPEFGKVASLFDMDMRRLIPVSRVEEETIRADIQNSWHNSSQQATAHNGQDT